MTSALACSPRLANHQLRGTSCGRFAPTWSGRRATAAAPRFAGPPGTAELKNAAGDDEAHRVSAVTAFSFAGPPLTSVEAVPLDLLWATGDGETVSVYVPALRANSSSAAHGDLERAFARWPQARRWRVEFFGEVAFATARAVGLLEYLRDLACAGISVALVAVPQRCVADLHEMFTGLQTAKMPAGDEPDHDEPHCVLRWVAPRRTVGPAADTIPSRPRRAAA
ncbi:MAG: hypothetical protein B7733_10190 [Myxococcales bacterium FL481]|nr:MAG: hypothetical protein B7733_10190 [Myxococcales bacterium FL481]